ncbi:unnamed protein product [Candida verbasci]|uniref:Zn(2)-C6 fungal-type domain-containing protein n=1 Tax=Candida verbasci TaxID=1227364 RepID=A0A9W4XAX0_9ASCO|nr:unnamed protein product [Candida verbasci]
MTEISSISNNIPEVNNSSCTSPSTTRKRNKPTLVCTNCKKKKIKCDRKNPCSSCVKMNVGYTCTYESKFKSVEFKATKKKKSFSPEIKSQPDNLESLPLQDELLRLQSRVKQLESILGKQKRPSKTKPYTRNQPIEFPTNPITPNPIVNDDDMINIYEGYTPLQMKGNIRRISYGPLSWVAIVKKDPYLCLTWKNYCNKSSYSIINTRLPQFTSENISALKSNYEKLKDSDKFFQKRFLELEGFNEIIPYKSLTKNEIINDTKSESKRPTFTEISLAKSIFDGRLDPELQLIEKIKIISPKKKVFWVLIDRWFKSVYNFFPFLDEKSFKKELVKIFGPVSYEDKPFDKVKIEKKLDLANCAICFILLRMTYLSLFSNRDCVNASIMKSETESIEKYLFQHPINISVIEVANSCIQCFPFTRKSNLNVFQAVLYMRIYRNVAPEEGDGVDGGDSQVSTALLIQMAYNLGLNREPSKFNDLCNDEKTNHLSRKIWSYLLRSDLMLCYTLGNPKTINKKHYDIKTPYVTKENSNIEDLEMETAIVDTFVYLENELAYISKVVDYILDINNSSSVNQLSTDLHAFEKVLHNFFNVVGNPTAEISIQSTRPDIVLYYQSTKLRIFLSSKTALIAFYHLIYLHYEKILDNELSFFYLCKIYQIGTKDLVPQIREILHGKYSSLGLILNPNLQLAIHKVNSFNMSCLVRVNYNLRTMENNKNHPSRMQTDLNYAEHFHKLSSISNNVRRTSDLTARILARIGSRYYYAWRTSKAHAGLIQALSDPDFYDKQTSCMKKIKAFQFTPTQLNECDKLIHTLGKQMEKLVYYKDTIDGQNYDSSPPNEFEKIPIVASEFTKHTNNNNTNSATSTVSNELITPSSIRSPLLDTNKQDSNYIDQMWLSMVAMKYDPTQFTLNEYEDLNLLNSVNNSNILPPINLMNETSPSTINLQAQDNSNQPQILPDQNDFNLLFYNTELDLIDNYNLDH